MTKEVIVTPCFIFTTVESEGMSATTIWRFEKTEDQYIAEIEEAVKEHGKKKEKKLS